jgi:hypothetical protein
MPVMKEDFPRHGAAEKIGDPLNLEDLVQVSQEPHEMGLKRVLKF